MNGVMKSYAPQAYALLRIITGLLLACHGAQKLFGFPPSAGGGAGAAPAYVIWLGGPIEFFGGLLVAFGLLAHAAAFLCSGQMAAAYWIGHGTKAFLPIENKGELAVIYCFVFLFIAAYGPGIWSVDAARGKG